MGGDIQDAEVTVWGLPPMWSEEEVEAFFVHGRCYSQEGDVQHVMLRNDQATVVFNSRETAQQAVEELHGLDLGDDGGGVLRCETKASASRPRPKSGPTSAPRLASASQAMAETSARLDDDEDTASSVQLRGLPFRAKVADIKEFLGDHAEDLATDGEPAISVLLNRDGRPSGFARVRFNSAYAAQACCESLHRQEMDSRYIEVLPTTRKPGKSRRQRRAQVEELESEGNGLDDADGSSTLDDESAREQVLQEVRKFVGEPGRPPPLLSGVGIAMSAASRKYLRTSGLGMKHFLARFSEEFRVEGPKGSERVRYLLGEDGGPAFDSNNLQSGNSEELVEAREPARHQRSAPPRPTQAPRPTRANPDETREPPKRSHAHLDPENHPGSIYTDIPMVRLRGLPFSTIARDVLAFFEEHAVEHCVTEGEAAVQMLSKANGRPSGQAVVHVHSQEHAEHVQQILNKQFIGDRYIEVFAYGDEGGREPKRKRHI